MWNNTNTTPEFHSIVDGIDDANSVNRILGEAIQYQYMFETRTFHSESHDFLEDDLQSFAIDINKINRLYYILHFDDSVSCRKYELLARMEYNLENVFVKLSAGYEFTRFGCLGGGVIYVTKNPNVFFNCIVEEENNRMKIRQSLIEDGYCVSEPNSLQVLDEDKFRFTELLAMKCSGSVQAESMSNASSFGNLACNYPRVQHPQYAELHYK